MSSSVPSNISSSGGSSRQQDAVPMMRPEASPRSRPVSELGYMQQFYPERRVKHEKVYIDLAVPERFAAYHRTPWLSEREKPRPIFAAAKANKNVSSSDVLREVPWNGRIMRAIYDHTTDLPLPKLTAEQRTLPDTFDQVTYGNLSGFDIMRPDGVQQGVSSTDEAGCRQLSRSTVATMLTRGQQWNTNDTEPSFPTRWEIEHGKRRGYFFNYAIFPTIRASRGFIDMVAFLVFYSSEAPAAHQGLFIGDPQWFEYVAPSDRENSQATPSRVYVDMQLLGNWDSQASFAACINNLNPVDGSYIWCRPCISGASEGGPPREVSGSSAGHAIAMAIAGAPPGPMYTGMLRYPSPNTVVTGKPVMVRDIEDASFADPQQLGTVEEVAASSDIFEAVSYTAEKCVAANLWNVPLLFPYKSSYGRPLNAIFAEYRSASKVFDVLCARNSYTTAMQASGISLKDAPAVMFLSKDLNDSAQLACMIYGCYATGAVTMSEQWRRNKRYFPSDTTFGVVQAVQVPGFDKLAPGANMVLFDQMGNKIDAQGKAAWEKGRWEADNFNSERRARFLQNRDTPEEFDKPSHIPSKYVRAKSATLKTRKEQKTAARKAIKAVAPKKTTKVGPPRTGAQTSRKEIKRQTVAKTTPRGALGRESTRKADKRNVKATLAKAARERYPFVPPEMWPTSERYRPGPYDQKGNSAAFDSSGVRIPVPKPSGLGTADVKVWQSSPSGVASVARQKADRPPQSLIDQVEADMRGASMPAMRGGSLPQQQRQAGVEEIEIDDDDEGWDDDTQSPPLTQPQAPTRAQIGRFSAARRSTTPKAVLKATQRIDEQAQRTRNLVGPLRQSLSSIAREGTARRARQFVQAREMERLAKLPGPPGGRGQWSMISRDEARRMASQSQPAGLTDEEYSAQETFESGAAPQQQQQGPSVDDMD